MTLDALLQRKINRDMSIDRGLSQRQSNFMANLTKFSLDISESKPDKVLSQFGNLGPSNGWGWCANILRRVGPSQWQSKLKYLYFLHNAWCVCVCVRDEWFWCERRMRRMTCHVGTFACYFVCMHVFFIAMLQLLCGFVNYFWVCTFFCGIIIKFMLFYSALPGLIIFIW